MAGQRMIPPLTGREAEREELRRTLDQPAGPHRLIRGGFGSGKTALLTDLFEKAADMGQVVLWASCVPADRLRGGSLMRQLGASRWTPGSSSSEQVAEAAGPPGPLVVFIDDLQWADADSLKALADLLRASDSDPKLLNMIASLGPGDSGDEYALGRVLRFFHHRTQLSPLSGRVMEHHARTLVAEAPEEVLRSCLSATGGNHYLFRTVLGALIGGSCAEGEQAPEQIMAGLVPEVSAAVRPLLRFFGSGCEKVATVLAVLETALPAEVIAHVSSMDMETAEDLVHALARAGVVERVGDCVRMASRLLAAALAYDTPPSRRAEYHARAARFLVTWGAPAEQLARHVFHSPPGLEFAVPALRAAADVAMARCVPEEALTYLRRALREEVDDGARGELLAQLGRAEMDCDVPAAVKELRTSLSLAGHPAAQASAARQLASALFAVDHYEDAVAVLQRTIERLRPRDPAFALRLELDYLLVSMGEPEPARQTRARLRQLSMDHATTAAVERPLAALLSFRAAALGEMSAQAVEWALHGLRRGLLPTDDESLVYSCAALALSAAGRPDLTLEHAAAAVAQSQAQASVLAFAQSVSARANALCRLGRFSAAQADAEAALAALGGIGIGRSESHCVFAVATLAEALIRQGRVSEAEALLVDSDLMGPSRTHMLYDYPLVVRAWLHDAQGKQTEALADLLHCGERLDARGMPAPGFYPWRSEAALLYLRRGEGERALALTDKELQLARTWGVPETIAVALRARGLVTGGRSGLDHLEEACRILAGTPARFRYAQAQADRGLLALECGYTDEGRAALRDAASLAFECGAESVGDQALAGLRSLGDRPRTPTFRGRTALTLAQRQVAELAAQGMTNAEIAQRLYVGVRTVEMHLTKAYTKLGVQGRHALYEALN
ncbi:AAA family ATPase [Streptomyces sp. NPDC101116]|uniref:ATP-binding protein n=1 Tax=Streptomyces sp. NPDC101116 TaxID=3366107 RepID=UPI003827E02C